MTEVIQAQVKALLDDVFGGPETGVIREILFSIDNGTLAPGYGWPEIIDVRQEFPVPGGRIDLLLFHIDGSATVIEAKATDSARELMAGVGQLMGYGVQVGYSRTLTKVRLALASRVPTSELRKVRPILRACGIEPMFCGRFDKWAAMFVESL